MAGQMTPQDIIKLMSFNNTMKTSPILRPMPNIGCLLDIPTGRYYLGEHGESILNGGLAPITGIGGKPNTYKSTLGHFMNLRVLIRYLGSILNCYDTEVSGGESRLLTLAHALLGSNVVDLVEDGRLTINDATIYTGDKWFTALKDHAVNKENNRKHTELETPFLSRDGSFLKSYLYSLAECDSLTRMNIETVDLVLDKTEVGGKDNNITPLKDAGAKHQMLIQLPVFTALYGIYMTFMAHVDKELTLEIMSHPEKKLAFFQQGLKFKSVSGQFYYLMNNLWYCFSASKYINKTTKTSMYPRDKDDNDIDNYDLMEVTTMNLRGKYGLSGSPFNMVASQSLGVLPSLTEFDYMKSNNSFGIGGNDRNYFLELVPDVALQRTTVRGKLDSDPRLQRATEISSELLQINKLWKHIDPKYRVDVTTLKADLEKQGYKWDELLNTRGYWTFRAFEEFESKKFLSTMDLLRMRTGEYKPYWMQ